MLVSKCLKIQFVLFRVSVDTTLVHILVRWPSKQKQSSENDQKVSGIKKFWLLRIKILINEK